MIDGGRRIACVFRGIDIVCTLMIFLSLPHTYVDRERMNDR